MVNTRKQRIVIDTNWYISATINKASRRTLYQLLISPHYIFLYSDDLISEYKSVIARDKFVKYIKVSQAMRFMALVMPRLCHISITSLVRISRDIKDDYLLAMSKDGKADFLITGDPDLLALKKFDSTTILTMREFMEGYSQWRGA